MVLSVVSTFSHDKGVAVIRLIVIILVIDHGLHGLLSYRILLTKRLDLAVNELGGVIGDHGLVNHLLLDDVVNIFAALLVHLILGDCEG